MQPRSAVTPQASGLHRMDRSALLPTRTTAAPELVPEKTASGSSWFAYATLEKNTLMQQEQSFSEQRYTRLLDTSIEDLLKNPPHSSDCTQSYHSVYEPPTRARETDLLTSQAGGTPPLDSPNRKNELSNFTSYDSDIAEEPAPPPKTWCDRFWAFLSRMWNSCCCLRIFWCCTSRSETVDDSGATAHS